MRRAAVLVATAVALTACGGEGDPLNPVAVFKSDEDAGIPSPIPDAGPDAPAPPPVTPRRTVIERNPFGNVAETQNLLWDGDFEWSSPFSDQYGWLSGPPVSYAFDGVAIGAECRSGIKCARVPKNRTLVGIGVGSKDDKLDASFFAKPRTGSCAGIEARLVSLFVDSIEPDPDLVASSEAPDADGWCRFGVVAEQRPGKQYLWIDNETGDEVLVDDAAVKKAPRMAALQTPPRAPSAAEVEQMATLRAELRDLMGPHDPPPNAAQRAFEASRRR